MLRNVTVLPPTTPASSAAPGPDGSLAPSAQSAPLLTAANTTVSLVDVAAMGMSFRPPPITHMGGLLSCADSIAFITRSRFHNLTLVQGSGSVVASWSSVSCGSLLCDALLSHITITDSVVKNCRYTTRTQCVRIGRVPLPVPGCPTHPPPHPPHAPLPPPTPPHSSTTSGGAPDIGNGGAVYQRDATGSVMRSAFSGCHAEGAGGAISCEGFSRLALADTEVADNVAFAGGGLALTSAVAVFISNTTFLRNSALNRGGALYFNAVR
jgi:predicted outer membrane repeat protein